jgi:predicted transcriptional regulator
MWSMDSFSRPQVPREKIPQAIIAKWGYEVLSEGFIPFPKKLLRCLPELLGDDGIRRLQAILAIIDYRRSEPIGLPSKDFLAYNAGLTLEEFKSIVADLTARGLIDGKGTDQNFAVSTKGLTEAILKEAETADARSKAK